MDFSCSPTKYLLNQQNTWVRHVQYDRFVNPQKGWSCSMCLLILYDYYQTAKKSLVKVEQYTS